MPLTRMTTLTVGERFEYTAHGRTFRLCRLRRAVWFLRALDAERARFGDLEQIREDIAHTLTTGQLPARHASAVA